MERLWETGELVERVDYLGNIYGFVESECKSDRVVAVLPDGLRQLKSRKDLDIFAVYLDVSYDVRKSRMTGRADDNAKIEERLKADDAVFAGVEEMVDLIINNDDKTIDEIVDIVLKAYR